MIRLLPSLLSLVLLVCQTQALYFYIDGPSQKCFFEELPKDTLVVGSYKATQWNEQSRSYIDNPEMVSVTSTTTRPIQLHSGLLG